MSDTAKAAGRRAGQDGTARSFWSWKIIAVVLALLAAAAGGAAYWFLVERTSGQSRPAVAAEPVLPFYLEVKPLVVSMRGSDGAAHIVQLGVNLTLSGGAVGKLVDAMQPEVQDAMRLTALSFQVDDIETPAGIEKMRAKMTADVNRMLRQRLGAERIAGVNAGRKDAVQNIYFSTLVIE